MISKEIENVYKNRKKISEEYLEKDSGFSSVVSWNKDPDTKSVDLATDEMVNNLKEFYLNKIGKENIKNCPDYDPELVYVDKQFGTIDDLNFPPSFSGTFIKCFLIDLGIWLLSSFAAVITNIYLFGLIGLAGMILVTIAIFADHRSDAKILKKSSKKSEKEKQQLNRVKYAPILALLILLILNFISGFFI